jgi:hypothetical protein
MKISTHSLVLPLLAGLAAFSSKTKFPDYELTLFFSWVLFLTFASLFIRSFRYRELAVVLVSLLIVIRVLIQLTDAPAVITNCYFVGGIVLMVFAGLSVFLKIPALLLRQMYWLAAISVIISLLQIHGVPWAQEFGSAIDDNGLSAGRVWFQGYEVVCHESAPLSQARPDGFTHANNLTSQLLLMFYAFCFYCFTAETGLPKASSAGLFVIAFAIALNAGKVVVLGIILIWLTSLVLGNVRKKRLLLAIAITLGAYWLYGVLFPGIFILNFNPDLFVYNASGRIINFGVMANTEIFVPFADLVKSLGTGRYISEIDFLLLNNLAAGYSVAYSGIGTMIPYLPVILVGVFVTAFLWKSEAWRLDRLGMANLRSGSVIMSVALLASVFGGPFYRTVWFVFFLSLAIAPLLCRFYDNKFIRSVSRPRD